eukprot:NODE_127_length_18646_cov_0.421632.p9 type:complete len:150 gc:universal NODE_127_length_18646_cov_0.421632:16195-16644(+)
MIMLLVSMLFGNPAAEESTNCKMESKAWAKLALANELGYCNKKWNKDKKGCANLESSLGTATENVENVCLGRRVSCDDSPGVGCTDTAQFFCNGILYALGAGYKYESNVSGGESWTFIKNDCESNCVITGKKRVAILNLWRTQKCKPSY